MLFDRITKCKERKLHFSCTATKFGIEPIKSTILWCFATLHTPKYLVLVYFMLSRHFSLSLLAARKAAKPRIFNKSAREFISGKNKIVYTETDEAPALATYSLLPIVKAFAKKAGIEVEKTDISLSGQMYDLIKKSEFIFFFYSLGRIIAQFPKYLADELRQPDNLSELGELCKQPHANIIKLPNISASLPQLNDAIMELRTKGYDIPLYVAKPATEKEKVIHSRYAKVLGSAVNPVIREGNSDRRVAAPVKAYAKKNPHSMGSWSKGSRSHVVYMDKGDFYENEQSLVMKNACQIRIQHVDAEGQVNILKDYFSIQEKEVIDATFMSVRELKAFYEREIEDAYKEHMLLSLHLKATMMKVSDPIMFGHCVRTFFKPVFEKHAAIFKELGVNPNSGLNDLFEKIKKLPEATKVQVENDIAACYHERPWLAMVNSDKGITNLHVPSDVIIDASMPVVIRDSGKMWNKDGELEDTKCLIPDRSYAMMYEEIMSYCRLHGQFDVSTMGSVSNVGLMAQKAEEYGSHDKTFEIAANGRVQVVDDKNNLIFEHTVEAGDIWRMCQTKDAAIKDWVKLAVTRARATGTLAIFWLDEHRAHDLNLIDKVTAYLKEHNTAGLDIDIMSPVHAMRLTCERAKESKDTISVTGNVLRDYLTDLFPILELGTSAKMLSIVPLLAGGGLFETGAGGSAPKHVQQFMREGHLRWDSLGEYLALAVSLEHYGEVNNNAQAKDLAESLNQAIQRLLENRKSPSRRVNELDNRASNFYIALYWAEFMALKNPSYADLAVKLKAARHDVVAELKACQGRAVDLGGYYKFDPFKVELAMRPSPTFNNIIDHA